MVPLLENGEVQFSADLLPVTKVFTVEGEYRVEPFLTVLLLLVLSVAVSTEVAWKGLVSEHLTLMVPEGIPFCVCDYD